jgi:hypothetical protein
MIIPKGVAMFGTAPVVSISSEKRILCCTCPFCKEQVEAVIEKGKIHCPKCKKEVDYHN